MRRAEASANVVIAAREAMVESDDFMPALRDAVEDWDNSLPDGQSCLICGSEVQEIQRGHRDTGRPLQSSHPLYQNTAKRRLQLVVEFACTKGHRGVVMENEDEAIPMATPEQPDG